MIILDELDITEEILLQLDFQRQDYKSEGETYLITFKKDELILELTDGYYYNGINGEQRVATVRQLKALYFGYHNKHLVKDYKKYIIIGDAGKPMSWSREDNQLCYTNSTGYNLEVDETPFLTATYPLAVANEYIRLSKEYRKKGKFDEIRYTLYQIA